MNLLKLNKKCELACNGKEAINILVSKYSKETRCQNKDCRGIELIFMDYQMPVMDGVQSTLAICSMVKDEVINPVNIVACTAFGANEDIERCLNAGMCDFVIKPISFDVVHNIVKKWIISKD
eukprot:TRINITY_DN2363_c1_g1_i1.p1 TRINITY_DN2363_c1_g1~~TRINITY_DN2363_c1_g1_i1.p1  ORF type:complete len:122 (+),score=30.06 TRINITY_DN2363_c1_g1_i1:234-599(+)